MYLLNNLLEVAEKSNSGFRLFHRISFNNGQYWLSVQASYGHYCTPRKTLKKEQYTAFEVMAEITLEDRPTKWEEYYDCYGVYGYVPREEIEDLIQILAEKYGLDS